MPEQERNRPQEMEIIESVFKYYGWLSKLEQHSADFKHLVYLLWIAHDPLYKTRIGKLGESAFAQFAHRMEIDIVARTVWTFAPGLGRDRSAEIQQQFVTRFKYELQARGLMSALTPANKYVAAPLETAIEARKAEGQAESPTIQVGLPKSARDLPTGDRYAFWKTVIGGIIATVLGGIILAFITWVGLLIVSNTSVAIAQVLSFISGLILSNVQIPIWLIGLFVILAISLAWRIGMPAHSAPKSDVASLAEYEEPRDLEIDLLSLGSINVSINPAQPTLSVRIRCTNKTRHRIRITGAQVDFYCGVRVTGLVLLDIEVKPHETLGIGGSLNNAGILVECTLNDNARAWFEQHREAGHLGGGVTIATSLTVTVQAEDEEARQFTKSWSAANFDSRLVWID